MKHAGLLLPALLALVGCAHGPAKSGGTVPAAVVVRECLGSAEGAGSERVATVYATAQAIRLEVDCGRRPFRIVYRAGEEQYTHHDVAAGETHTFTTAQVRELLELRTAVAKAALEKAKGAGDPQQAMAAILSENTDTLSPLRFAKFQAASIGETLNGIRCRRFEIASGNELMGEACLTRADNFGVQRPQFGAFLAAREKFQGLLGTSFELFDPFKAVDGVDYLIVRLSFGDGRRGIAVPRLLSAATKAVPVELWDPRFIATRAEK